MYAGVHLAMWTGMFCVEMFMLMNSFVAHLFMLHRCVKVINYFFFSFLFIIIIIIIIILQ